jgi:nucleotide-binding universal stress UspA family protein
MSPMTYKTILVYLSDKRRAEAVLEPAIDLATRFNAHLIGLHVHAAVSAPPVNVPFGSRVLGSIAASARGEAEAIGAIFADMTARQPFVAEWRELKVPHVDLASVVMDHGRAADLLIAGQTDPDWDMAPLMDFPDRLALECGRPVLVIPCMGRYPKVGQDVMIAWKAGRECARAVFDALPLLVNAKVRILEISERSGDGNASSTATAIAASLARHGIKPTVQTSILGGSIGVGDEILSRAADAEADLLVMGAYGYSRMRELVFGGATRHLLRHMTLPTLLSH